MMSAPTPLIYDLIIHHPTDSTLLGDGVRVLTRIMRRQTRFCKQPRELAFRTAP
jgi:hypothetical protein